MKKKNNLLTKVLAEQFVDPTPADQNNQNVNDQFTTSPSQSHETSFQREEQAADVALPNEPFLLKEALMVRPSNLGEEDKFYEQKPKECPPCEPPPPAPKAHPAMDLPKLESKPKIEVETKPVSPAKPAEVKDIDEEEKKVTVDAKVYPMLASLLVKAEAEGSVSQTLESAGMALAEKVKKMIETEANSILQSLQLSSDADLVRSEKHGVSGAHKAITNIVCDQLSWDNSYKGDLLVDLNLEQK